MNGHFITFEGLDGCGKTTQLHKLADALTAAGRNVVVTREPGGTAIGEKIRSLILDSRTEGMAPRAELALMFASRAQQIAQVIKPAMREGKIVLCDRFTDSSEAYQGFGRQLGSDAVLAMHKVTCGDFKPELTILLVGDAQSGLDRARARNSKEDDKEGRFEREQEDFFKRVADGYAAIAKRDKHRVVVVEASRTIDEVHADIAGAVREHFPGVL
jgi:dTMP kinase